MHALCTTKVEPVCSCAEHMQVMCFVSVLCILDAYKFGLCCCVCAAYRLFHVHVSLIHAVKFSFANFGLLPVLSTSFQSQVNQ